MTPKIHEVWILQNLVRRMEFGRVSSKRNRDGILNSLQDTYKHFSTEVHSGKIVTS